MNLFAGLEKFGIKADNTTDLFEDEKKPAASADGGKTEAAPTEDSFLLDKAIRCTVSVSYTHLTLPTNSLV